MTKEMKRPTSDITQDSIKPSLSNAVEFYTNKIREAHKCIQERDEYINYLESKLSNAKPQQALPVVPEFVAEFIDKAKENLSLYGALFYIRDDTNKELDKWVFRQPNQDLFARAWLDGYEIEKPNLFYIALPKVYRLNDSVFVSKIENGTISEFIKGKDCALKLTEQEIKSIDERYWQFAVPVEDGE
ncbi:DUF1642 domain-containing protein [Lactococcus lactis]|uniref:DUF1642 domain-containing protein n=1 Tax=Lactococcus lactis TaxID=1358 RepID=UPI00223B5D3A|nr:DUF1642 domain-containing protein [Lactococcus lactis]MCT1228281.1 DUF1642 domain-containing protein [Lactococcus lactis]